jgi:DNA-binding transcriptional LysR family regulator
MQKCMGRYARRVDDWDDLRFFLAIARAGSLSAAARALDVAQPTAGRRLVAFERAIGAKLFVAVPGGQRLTATGRRILTHAERMEAEAFAVEHAATGRDAGPTGRVRITASEWLIERVVAPVIGPLLARHPGLEAELAAEARHVNLLRREADITLRPSRSQHRDVVERGIATIAFALYASDAYLAAHGAPRFDDACEGARLIAMPRGFDRIPDVEWLPIFARRARVVARANGRLAMATLAASGVGMAVLPVFVGDATPGLRRLATPAAGPRRKLFLAAHGDARQVPRVRVTLDHLAAAIQHLGAALAA